MLFDSQQRFNQEQAAYQQRLEDNENEKQILEAELLKVKDKLERSKLDELKESEDVVQELRDAVAGLAPSVITYSTAIATRSKGVPNGSKPRRWQQ